MGLKIVGPLFQDHILASIMANHSKGTQPGRSHCSYAFNHELTVLPEKDSQKCHTKSNFKPLFFTIINSNYDLWWLIATVLLSLVPKYEKSHLVEISHI